MPVEIAVATPFDSTEICEIAVEEFRSRLRGLGPLQHSKEYAYFELQFEVRIKLQRAGEESYEAKETLAWANVVAGNPVDGPSVEEVAELSDTFKSKEPNVERVDRDMPLNVETSDGKGNRVTKKVRIKG